MNNLAFGMEITSSLEKRGSIRLDKREWQCVALKSSG